MPDQSQSNEPVSGKTEQKAGDPADTSANTPDAATQESLESNVTRASDGEKAQADQTINNDPTVATGDEQTAGTAAADDYDDEDKYGYRDLQQLAKSRDLDASGKRDEIVARLRAADGVAEQSNGEQIDTPPVPRAAVDDQVVVNGGIQLTGRGQEHAELLQGLSKDRKAQQLAAVKERSERAEE